MTIQTVRLAKTSKNFLRNSFRKTINLIFLSLLINGFLIFGIYTNLINRKPPDYYATSGVTPPVPLNALSAPNESLEPLLKPDPVSDSSDTMVNYGNNN